MANTNDLRIEISQRLDKKFPNINIYEEGIEQEFKKPYFFIKLLNSIQSKEFNNRYKKSVCFDINYFSDREDINSDCLDIADKLYEFLEYVPVGNSLYRATNMKHEVIDEVLHFFFQFNYKVVKQIEEVPKMQTLDREVVTKND
ncbi:DUF6838 family protein [uncultured Clostridium sp.]|uniref:phage tail terminator family protein n=1 Tax=uncultured Clostridium sp. TaxID=59620 RepID=UPI0028ECEB98|nr:hypothetical protein [uncultured Clostridium sp.]